MKVLNQHNLDFNTLIETMKEYESLIAPITEKIIELKGDYYYTKPGFMYLLLFMSGEIENFYVDSDIEKVIRKYRRKK